MNEQQQADHDQNMKKGASLVRAVRQHTCKCSVCNGQLGKQIGFALNDAHNRGIQREQEKERVKDEDPCPPDWQERVMAEKKALDAKIMNLDNFIYGRAFHLVSNSEQARLMYQRLMMVSYATILDVRIEAF